MVKQTTAKRPLSGAAAKGAGPGRPKGSVNKNTALIRDMVAQALDKLGGIDYFERVAESHPAAFMALIGKTMPIQVEGAGGGAIAHSLRVEFIGKP